MSEEQKPLETTVENLESSFAQSGDNNSKPLVDASLESNPAVSEAFPGEAGSSTQSATPSEMANPEEIIANLQQEMVNLKQQLDDQTEQGDTLKKRYISLAAEFDNFRKRTQKEKEELEVQVKRKTLSELLSVVDNFDRARTQIKPSNDGEMAIHKSYQGVYKNLVDGLKRLGVSAMRPEGQPFDPSYHEAMLREYTDDYPEGTVIEQLVRGYLIGDQVLRHAMVKVAAAKDPNLTSESTEGYHRESSEGTSDSSF